MSDRLLNQLIEQRDALNQRYRAHRSCTGYRQLTEAYGDAVAEENRWRDKERHFVKMHMQPSQAQIMKALESKIGKETFQNSNSDAVRIVVKELRYRIEKTLELKFRVELEDLRKEHNVADAKVAQLASLRDRFVFEGSTLTEKKQQLAVLRQRIFALEASRERESVDPPEEIENMVLGLVREFDRTKASSVKEKV